MLFRSAALRNEQFFSLAELNASIREKLDAYNARKFQKKECSRPVSYTHLDVYKRQQEESYQPVASTYDNYSKY